MDINRNPGAGNAGVSDDSVLSARKNTAELILLLDKIKRIAAGRRCNESFAAPRSEGDGGTPICRQHKGETMNEIMNPETMLKAAIGKNLQACEMTDGIAGDLLLFAKGKYTRGQDKTLVPAGTRFRPNPWEFWWGWQKYENRRVTGLRLCRVTEGQPPSRNDLGDLDEAMWEDPARDPWAENRRFVALDENGGLVTFSANSAGGRKACHDLLKAFFQDVLHEGQWPVVSLGVGYFTSPEYGQIAKPAFNIVAWDEPWAEPSGDLLALQAATNGTAKAIEAPKADKTFEARSITDLDDEIPF